MSDIAQMIEQHSKAMENRLEEADKKARELEQRLFDQEQKSAAMRFGGAELTPATWGSAFVGERGDEVKGLTRNRTVGVEVKATLTSATGTITTPHRDNVSGLPQERMTVRSLLSVVPVTTGTAEYPAQTVRNLNANVVPEGDLKPESELGIELRQVPIRTIAHWIPASLQVLDDNPQLQAMIDGELRYGVALKEEQQLLYGSGVGANLLGMVPQAAAFASAGDIPATTAIDRIGLGIMQAALTNVAPDGIIIHPVDWWRMRLLKNAAGEYILGNPQADVTPSLFGLPLVVTPAMAAGNFLVGAFKAQTLYDRWSTRIDVSTEHADFFVRNLCAIRAENRIGFAAKRPEALVYGALAAA